MSGIIQRVARHRPFWGPACLCHFLRRELQVPVSPVLLAEHTCCFTSCMSAQDGKRRPTQLSGHIPTDVTYSSGAASLRAALSEYDGDSLYGTACSHDAG